MYQPTEVIPIAGPAISERELAYVTDALRHGWNRRHRDYVDRFEQAFARCVGRQYAVATNSGAAAQHLALLALSIGPGDEVIVPDLGFVSAANVCRYVGATPVFADVSADTWGLDPASAARAITPKTRAIMPVYTFGTPPDVLALQALAHARGIAVIEDAAPAVGTTVNGRPAGSFSQAAAFSFQESKIVATGEGGMLVTDESSVAEQARSLGSHGRDPRRSAWYPQIGYMYRMPNLQAALGLAQLERVEEFVAAKRQVFGWYRERLGGIAGLRLNPERDGVRNNYALVAAVLEGTFAVTRDELVTRLRERLIEARPFFPPISSFPMYERRSNPVAERIAASGLNLPSGVLLREEEADYVARHVRAILGAR